MLSFLFFKFITFWIFVCNKFSLEVPYFRENTVCTYTYINNASFLYTIYVFLFISIFQRREVTPETGEALGERWHCGFIETSAKCGENITEYKISVDFTTDKSRIWLDSTRTSAPYVCVFIEYIYRLFQRLLALEKRRNLTLNAPETESEKAPSSSKRHCNILWDDLIWADRIWADLILDDLIWADLIWADLIWADLI